eukprot:PITA_05702
MPATAMAKTSVADRALGGLLPLDTKIWRSVRKSQASQIHMTKKRGHIKAESSRDNSQFWSEGASSVDAELIVLRKRMQKQRLQERNYSPPQHWMKWEKDWSVTYASDVYEIMGLLQNKLMNTRPCIAMASLVLISLSVPASLLLLLSRLL